MAEKFNPLYELLKADTPISIARKFHKTVESMKKSSLDASKTALKQNLTANKLVLKTDESFIDMLDILRKVFRKRKAFLESAHLLWEAAKLTSVRIANTPVTKIFQTKSIQQSLWNAYIYMI